MIIAMMTDGASGRAAGSWRRTLEILVQFTMMAAAVILVYIALESRAERQTVPGAGNPTLPNEPVSLAGAPTKGSVNATAALVIYSDFECPFCGRFAKETLPDIERTFVATGKVLVAFRNLPLERIHPFAKRAAEGALCAGQQGKFWEMHDQLFESKSRFDDAGLRVFGGGIGLNIDAFDACLTKGQGTAQVEADIVAAKSLGIGGTPAFLIGVRLPDGTIRATSWLSGSRPFADFQKELGKALRTSRP